MALKLKYAKQTDIPKGAEEHYAEKDGAWVLDADYEDTTALKAAKEHEKKARQTAEGKVRDLETTLGEKDEELNSLREGAIPKADVEALKKSYQGKYDKDIKERDEKIAALGGTVNKHLKDGEAVKIAAELFTSPNAGLPHVMSRLTVEQENGEFVTKVLGPDGKPSALTIDDLKKEILQNKDLAPILVGSRASGGGANGGQGGSGAPTGDGKPFDAAKASPKDFVAHIKAKKEAGGE